jgi:hypothetical protein
MKPKKCRRCGGVAVGGGLLKVCVACNKHPINCTCPRNGNGQKSEAKLKKPAINAINAIVVRSSSFWVRRLAAWLVANEKSEQMPFLGLTDNEVKEILEPT